ncbi:MAG TPA: FAD-binding oxidoreductase [Nocardioidaceae bacterium]|nr:FAD-binding oxidoreductase [Nocardioidaceae bacterium]
MRDVLMTSAFVDRRAVLRGGGAIAALAAAELLVRPLPIAAARTAPTQADWNALQRDIDGAVIQRGDNGYPKAHQLFDPRFDDLHPLAVVECTSAADVSAAIQFAKHQKLKCRPKAGGHSYVGASSLKGGMVIDVSRITKASYDASTKIATIGAGKQLYNAHSALANHGRTIPTGTCPTVAAAGLTLGGGLGIASRQFGLTCDQLAGLTMVTADGKKKTVNASQHADLFWASQGGGGGNLGIVTTMRYHTQPTYRMGFFLMTFPWGQAAKVVRGWSKRIHQMPRTAWANLHLDASSDGSTDIRVVGTCRAGDEHSEATAMENAVGVAPTSVSTFQKTYMQGIEFLGGGTTSSRQTFAAGSDIIAKMSPDLAQAIVKLVKHRANHGKSVSAILDPLTGKVSDIKPKATAFPWRNHVCDIQWYIGLPNGASNNAVQSAYNWIGTAHKQVKPYSSGGYVNYLEPGRGLPSYYGPNFQRLKQIKAQVDPHGFFHTAYTIP